MYQFKVNINGDEEVVHTKHLGNGKYLVRKLRTANHNQVKYIETLFGNNCINSYRVTELYPGSKHSLATAKQEVIKLN